MTHLPAETKILLFVFEYCTVRQWPVLLVEAGLPQMACLVSMFHTTMLKTQKKNSTSREYVQYVQGCLDLHEDDHCSKCFVLKVLLLREYGH